MIGSVAAGFLRSMVCATSMTAGRSADSRNGTILRKLIDAMPGVASSFFCKSASRLLSPSRRR
jgi:hypothetical protein